MTIRTFHLTKPKLTKNLAKPYQSYSNLTVISRINWNWNYEALHEMTDFTVWIANSNQ